MARLELTAGFYRIEAEVAADDREAHAGSDAPAQYGQPTRACCSSFHRRGTPLHVDAKYASCPLSVAFLDEDGRILNIENMQPQTEENHCAAKSGALRAGNESRLVFEQGHQAGERGLAASRRRRPHAS
jgi:uncharacterized membrane protein (UPF0127 family)